MRSFGRSSVSAAALLDELLEIGCTVVVPTFTYELAQPAPTGNRPAQNAWDYDSRTPVQHDERYDAGENALSVKDMGVFSAEVLRRSNRVRGEHPLNSFSAVGADAREIIGTQRPDRVYGPLEDVCDRGGLVLLVGVGFTSMTLLHLAEKMAGRRLFQRWAKDSAGDIVTCHTGGCSAGFARFETVIDAFADDVIAGSRVRCFRADETVRVAANAIISEPTITHCDRDDCERCRDAILGGPHDFSADGRGYHSS